jgi:hypothetical protein
MSKKLESKTPPSIKEAWRAYPDYKHPHLTQWPSAESLHPSENTMINAIMGDESSRAILSSYRVCQFTYSTMTRAQLEAL